MKASIFACALLATAAQALEPTTLDPATWKKMVEADWIAYEESLLQRQVSSQVRPSDDAAGGCDGVINGQWGFHTAQAEKPWWQVDLGSPQTIARVKIWNRCQAAERAARLQLKFSEDGKTWRTVYQHNGTVFYGHSDQKPLMITISNELARYVRVELPGRDFLHLEEVEVFGSADPTKNLALNRRADQTSVSQWSVSHFAKPTVDWPWRTRAVVANCNRLAAELRKTGIASPDTGELTNLPPGPLTQADFLKARWVQRRLALANPLLDFDTILVTKRMPGSFNHMSDQYYGWWSRPGGGLYLLRNWKSDAPSVECISASFPVSGSFLRPALSYDGRKVLFAWCKHYPSLAAEKNKLDKGNVPEDAFYHLYEMNLDGTGLRQLTRGKYDDFDARYLPDGRIVFMSTRRGQFVQVDRDSAAQTVARGDLPDCYVRCGGDAERPVAVYTLHTINGDGSGLCAISPFEMFEWEPSVAHDGSVLYARWDYVDRHNMPYMSLWSTRPDGTGTRLVYGNYTRSPHCVFEPRAIPNSQKIVFTASAHHSQTMGSLVLLDPSVGTEGAAPLTRLTPEVCFPEIEGWPLSYYANPWPLSERFYLVSWNNMGAKYPGPEGWDRWHAVPSPLKDFGVYLYDAEGQLEPLFRDTEISSMYPIPVRPQPRPLQVADQVDWAAEKEGRFYLADVYQGLRTARRGEIKALRLLAVPPKTHPVMNFPVMGVTADDPGKCVLGTVPVEEDGSAYFRVPSGVTLFFQALDADGVAVQTMRTATHVQPGQTVSCVGCHENRLQAPRTGYTLASSRVPSRILEGPEGSWPFRFDRLVQPILDRHCTSCHQPGSNDKAAQKWDLTGPKAYDTLVRHGKPSVHEQVWAGYLHGESREGEGLARRSALLALLDKNHYDVKLPAEERERIVLWLDTYGQRLGAFSPEQEQALRQLRKACASLLETRSAGRQTAAINLPTAGR